MSSLYSAFSAFLCSVASATVLSKALMPASKAAISWMSVSMPCLAFSMAVPASATVRSKAFFLSSAVSNCAAQYSCLCASSSCSCFSMATMSSHILMTLSKPPAERARLPLRVRASRSSCGRSWASALLRMKRIMPRARARCTEALTLTCTRLAPALGKVFLKRSSASSSFSTLMVSARATSSSARVLERSSHSAVFVLQLCSICAK
mmetsp:Transcript_40003/g.103550  ORF Transcript_40003/g.103550 Transcript_40003/m.103550 type:complete len:207 (+) Transcript_40003:344-964(+)